MTRDDMLTHLRTAHEVALQAMGAGHHPFGAVLVGPDNAVLMRQGNVGTVRHAESELARRAAEEHARDFLWRCTLVTTFEPCAMCAGTLYWANIGTLVYGVAEMSLFALTGDDPDNPTMRLPARTVLASGQKKIAIHGPFPELEDELIAPHRGFWQKA
jgi:tRNA(Arg) A34 adenosine deaminase TadA